MISNCQSLLLLSVAGLFTCGCNMTFHIRIQSDPLKRPAVTRPGEVAMGELNDSRAVADKSQIGIARNGFGVETGTVKIKDNAKLESIIAESVVAALKEAGYRVVSPDDPIGKGLRHRLEGEVTEFWIDGSGWNLWNKVTLVLRLRDSDTGVVMWEREFKGQEDTPNAIGIWQASQQSVREALAIALNAAVVEFTSDEFHSKATARK